MLEVRIKFPEAGMDSTKSCCQVDTATRYIAHHDTVNDD